MHPNTERVIAAARERGLDVDSDLLDHDEVWAAAGTPRPVFRIAPHDLVVASAGAVCDLAVVPGT